MTQKLIKQNMSYYQSRGRNPAQINLGKEQNLADRDAGENRERPDAGHSGPRDSEGY